MSEDDNQASTFQDSDQNSNGDHTHAPVLGEDPDYDNGFVRKTR